MLLKNTFVLHQSNSPQFGKSVLKSYYLYRGLLPYANFGTWKKFTLAKNRISKVFILCTQ